MPSQSILDSPPIEPFPEEGFTPVHLQQWLNGRWLDGGDVRRAIEVSVPRQCIAAGCGEPPPSGLEAGAPLRCCYICGFPITHPGGSHAAASQCEHVLTVLVIAMICGLSHPDYQNIVNGWMDGNQTETMNGFYQYRERLLREGTGVAAPCGGGKYGTFYKWAHPSCNLIKNNFPYLPIRFGINGPEVDGGWVAGNDEFKQSSIKYTLYKLISYTEQNSRNWVNYWGRTGDQHGVRLRADITTFHPGGDASAIGPLNEWKQWADGRSQEVLEQYIQPIADILDERRYSQKKKKRYSAIAMNMTFKYFEEKLNRKRQQAEHLMIDLELRNYYASCWNTLKKEDRNQLGGLLLKANVRPRRISIPAKINKTIKKSKKVVRLFFGNPMQFAGGQIGGAGDYLLEEEGEDTPEPLQEPLPIPLSVYRKSCQEFRRERVREFSGDFGPAKLKLKKVREILPIISYMVNAITMLDGGDKLLDELNSMYDGRVFSPIELENLIGDEAHMYVELYKRLLIEYCEFEGGERPAARVAAEEYTWTGDDEYGLDLFLEGDGQGGLTDLGPLDLLWTNPAAGDGEQRNFYTQMIKVLNSFEPLGQHMDADGGSRVGGLRNKFAKPIYGADEEEILYGIKYTYVDGVGFQWIRLTDDNTLNNWLQRLREGWESLANSDNDYPMYKEFEHFKPPGFKTKRVYTYIFIMGEVNEGNTNHPFQITMRYSQWIAFFKKLNERRGMVGGWNGVGKYEGWGWDRDHNKKISELQEYMNNSKFRGGQIEERDKGVFIQCFASCLRIMGQRLTADFWEMVNESFGEGGYDLLRQAIASNIDIPDRSSLVLDLLPEMGPTNKQGLKRSLDPSTPKDTVPPGSGGGKKRTRRRYNKKKRTRRKYRNKVNKSKQKKSRRARRTRRTRRTKRRNTKK